MSSGPDLTVLGWPMQVRQLTQFHIPVVVRSLPPFCPPSPPPPSTLPAICRHVPFPLPDIPPHSVLPLFYPLLQVVYLGGGCLDAAPEVRDFIKRTQIPVASTLMGLGTFPATDPLALQMLGMHGTVFANYSVDQVGWVLKDSSRRSGDEGF